MDEERFDADALIDGTAPALGLTITDERRPAVRAFLTIAFAMKQTMDRAELDDDELALAPVFVPDDRPDDTGTAL
ncbi:MAG: DUF4089 domain-containing protein [Pseudomonadota bacterium]